MSSSFDFRQLSVNTCRICLDSNYSARINLEEDSKILLLLEYCAGITINLLQKSPKMLCTKCTEALNNFSEFKKRCVDSEDIWRKFADNDKIIKNERKTYQEIKIENSDQNECIESDTISHKRDKYTEDANYYSENSLEAIDNDKKLTFDIEKPDVKSGDIDASDQKCIRKVYQCHGCMKEYTSKKCLKTHLLSKCLKMKSKMIPVKQVGIRKKNTEISNNFNDGLISPLTCGLCNTYFTNDDDVKLHLRKHWLDNDIKCQLCSYCGNDFADMITHRQVHYSKMKLCCPVCSKMKMSLLSLQFHFRSVHLQKPGGVCYKCNRTFSKFRTWKKHERLHSANNLYICDYCGRKFLYKNDIKSHMIDHSDVRQYVCETCGKAFKRMFALKDHILNMHTPSDPVVCEHCNKTYKNQNKLRVHLKNIAKEKPFICEVCSKKFPTQVVLNNHMFWHTGERPFSCEVCGAKYKAKGQLNLHMRNHTGFKPHKCPDCGKNFPNGTQLRRHRSVHTGIRAHKCLHCERSFHVKKAMLEHAERHRHVENVKLEA